MAALQSSNPHLAIHLSDRSLTPLVSSSSRSTATASGNNTQAQALSSLTTAAISAYDSASRLSLGLPQRVMIETSDAGPVILHSFLNPQTAQRQQQHVARRSNSHTYGRRIVEEVRENMRPLSSTTDGSSVAVDGFDSMVNGMTGATGGSLGKHAVEGEDDDAEGLQSENEMQQPPLLIATVVASGTDEVREARQAAARLERMGREFQREWAREQEQQLEGPSEGA
ncbi:hypothetical protein F5884DRAFT_783104 [Xylogone sp. PMI_703]|nr:hypothetical protein F5884DRAFT_783104 [Xylogone sp. PMI_703]